MALRINPNNGRLQFEGHAIEISPSTSLAEFMASELARTIRRIDYRPEYQEAKYVAESTSDKGIREVVTLHFVSDHFSHAFVELAWPGDDPDSLRQLAYSNPQARLDQQEQWLRENAGAAPGDYSWGTVWNRKNIHTDLFDIAILYAK